MFDIRWDLSKNERLKRKRGISFEDILQQRLLAVMEHFTRAHQNIMLFEFKDHVWVVPYVVDERGIFLKTVFPSRKYTRIWKRRQLS